jgi:DNA-binding protein H-NS
LNTTCYLENRMTDVLDPTSLDALTLDELASYKEKIEKAFAERREQQKSGLLDQIKSLYTLGAITPQELAKHLGFKLEVENELDVPGKPPRKNKGQKIPPKYRDPANPENEWTGRGVRPKWLSAYLEDEKRTLEEFKIKDADPV